MFKLLWNRKAFLCTATVTVSLFFILYSLNSRRELKNAEPSFLLQTSSSSSSSSVFSSTPEIKIVIWTSPDKRKEAHILGDLERLVAKNVGAECFKDCNLQISNRNQSKVDEADAVLFASFTDSYNKKGGLPKRRSSSQIWVFKRVEPPTSVPLEEHLNGLFNWTMTYRHSSEIYLPYGKASAVKNHEQESNEILIKNKTLEEWIKGKIGVGTALISNCKAESGRLEVLQKLKHLGLHVDIYGKCGIKKGICGRKEKHCEDFFEELGSKYKFYFAFENSFCEDYISEKFWNAYLWGMVPVVLGKGNYEEVAPPHSYINVRDFPNPGDLVDYLQILDRDPEAYGKYFEWRKKFFVEHNGGNLCGLCDRLKSYKKSLLEEEENDPEKTHSSKQFYPDLLGWWYKNADGDGPSCVPKETMGIEKYL